MAVELPELLVPDAAAWRAWLTENHADSPGVWLVLTKKGGRVTELDYAAALDEALVLRLDRRPGRPARRGQHAAAVHAAAARRVAWSRRNVEHIARLTAEGRLTPAGQAAVDAAKADGRWEAAYAGPAAAEFPADLAEALAAKSAGAGDVGACSPRRTGTRSPTGSGRPSGPDTRAKRIAEFVAMLERGETVHPQRRQPQ